MEYYQLLLNMFLAPILSPQIMMGFVKHAENWSLTNFRRRIYCNTFDGFSHTKLRKQTKFDLIIANILAKPLRVLAPLIAQNLNSNCKVILSGLLTSRCAISDNLSPS